MEALGEMQNPAEMQNLAEMQSRAVTASVLSVAGVARRVPNPLNRAHWLNRAHRKTRSADQGSVENFQGVVGNGLLHADMETDLRRALVDHFDRDMRLAQCAEGVDDGVGISL